MYAQPVPAEDAEEPVQAEDVDEGDVDEGDEVPVEEQAPKEGEQPSEGQAPAEQAPAEGDEGAGDDEGWGEMSDEELAGEGEDPSRPPPAGKGVIWGVVRDSAHNEPAIEAVVTVVGTDIQVVTDFDGRYRLELPPGTYNIRIFYEMHKPLRLEGIKVAVGAVQQTDAVLEPEAAEDCDPETDPNCQVETFEIVEELEEASMESQTLERQQSAAVADGVARAEISKTPDSDAAQAAQRVPGATIVGGRFVYVRGLGERYSNALLFGSPLPSPEPDRAAVPLDLFPALVLDSVNIAKTFTPDYPADFAGGSVRVETRGVPSKFLFNVSVSGGYAPGSTFERKLDHTSSSTDWLAFDDGLRALPSEVPRDRPAEENGDTDAAKAIDSRMSPFRSTAYPDHSVSTVVGNGWLLPGKQTLGVIASLNYSRKFRIRDEVLREYQRDASDPRGFSERFKYDVERGLEQMKWGSYAGVAYKPTQNHEIRLMGLHTQIADDETRVYTGFDQNIATDYAVSQLSWVERAMSLAQLSGRHVFEALADGELGWDLGYATATRDEPNRRQVVYDRGSGSSGTFWSFRDGTESGQHFYADQTEDSITAKLDYKQPVAEASNVKVGGLTSFKNREFRARRFAFRRGQLSNDTYRCVSDEYPVDCPDQLFQDSNIGDRRDDPLLWLDEGTQETDAYDAKLNVYAGYLMGDLELVENLRGVLGARLEVTDQSIDPYNQFGTTTTPGASLDSTDVLPAGGLIFSATQKSKTRFSYGRTLARPQLRELAPFVFSDYFGGRQISGNPDLKLTKIDNYDMRFETFPTLREVLAFSIFAKKFTDPIEPILKPQSTSNRLTYRNAKSATLLGLELEARKNLGFLAPSVLNDFTFIGNLTLVHSRTETEQTGGDVSGQVQFITNPVRPLVNQAPWVLNLAMDYENQVGTGARVLYNVSGKTLTEVGTEGLPDAYVQPFHVVDFVVSQKFAKHWQVKGQAENILDAEKVVSQGRKNASDNSINRYKPGRLFSVGLSYTY